MTRHEERWQLAALAAIATVTAIVSSLGAPLVPEIATAYDVPLRWAQWALAATLLSGAVATPLVGRWGSGRLRRPVVLGGLGWCWPARSCQPFPSGSALSSPAGPPGVGLALVPLSLAVARDLWQGTELSARLGLLPVSAVAGARSGYPVTALVAGRLGAAGPTGSARSWSH